MEEDELKISIDRIGEDGHDAESHIPVTWLAEALGKDSPFRPDGDGEIRVHLQRIGRRETDPVVQVRGTTRCKLSATCSRCLEDMSLTVDTTVEVAFFPAGQEPAATSDGEVRSEDMGIATYSDKTIDLGDIVRDEVFLQLPMYPVCRETCLGLCPQCGANLNEGGCGCHQSSEERWNAFRNIKLN